MIARGSVRKRAVEPARLYLLHIRLAEIEPPIWRRVAVPGWRTLHSLHEIIQVAIGWENYHLYQFDIRGTRYEDPNPDDRDPTIPDPRTFILDQLDLTQGTRFQYRYDFGDDWLHDVTVEGAVPLPRDFLLPLCLGGARAGPPEDCGGVFGYDELLSALERPKSARAREIQDWLGRLFDPEELDLAAINKRFGHRLTSRRRAATPRSRRGAV
jgi:Plasmid pRiA4b ORF-3-like protein